MGSAGGSAHRARSTPSRNILEQVVLACVAQEGIAVTFTRSGSAIVVLAVLFSTGRALFWAGYAKGAAARSLGFALTFYPSVAALVAVAVERVIRSL